MNIIYIDFYVYRQGRDTNVFEIEKHRPQGQIEVGVLEKTGNEFSIGNSNTSPIIFQIGEKDNEKQYS